MQLYLYNTLSRSKEEFKPLDPLMVKMYSCGPTVYSDPHIGNLRAFFFAGLLGDVIRHIAGYPVTHVMNVTDVGHLTDDGDAGEDKMEKGSRNEGLDARALAKKYEQNFKQYIDQLHIHFDHIPRATDYIQEQIDIVKELQTNGYTYEIPGDGIYMDTAKVTDYGKLLPKGHLEGQQSGARVDIEGKKNPTDFALWKFSPRDAKRQMERESPRGVGFPGWHIECNAMSRAFLGDQFDIHTGGIDHIPVHHTDEIAQAECSYAHTKPRVKYRLHCQFLNIDNTKISKSLGNVLSLPQILERGFAPEDLRYFFLQAHYRSFQDFTREGLEAAKKARDNFIWKLTDLFNIDSEKSLEYLQNFNNLVLGMNAKDFSEKILKQDNGKKEFKKLCDLLLDDLHTPSFMAGFNVLLGSNYKLEYKEDIFATILFFDLKVLKLGIWSYLVDNISFFRKTLSHLTEITPEQEIANRYFEEIRRGNTEKAEDYLNPKMDYRDKNGNKIPYEILLLSHKRRQAKLAKDRSKADALRDELRSLGYEMKDGKEGYEVVKIS